MAVRIPNTRQEDRILVPEVWGDKKYNNFRRLEEIYDVFGCK